MLPSTIPLFPLSNVVLFPGVFLPLHIFEARYRALVADALTGDRVIGMVLLRPGWESDYEGRPPIYETGCAGLITHVDQMADGRYNLVLKGLSKFKVLGETHQHLYRIARVDSLTEVLGDAERDQLRDGRQQLEAVMAPVFEQSDRRLPASLSDDEVINALSQYLDLEPIERQALLECAGPVARCHLLLELLQMKVMGARHHEGPSSVH